MLSGTDVSLAHDGRLGGSRWYGWWRGEVTRRLAMFSLGQDLRRYGAFKLVA